MVWLYLSVFWRKKGHWLKAKFEKRDKSPPGPLVLRHCGPAVSGAESMTANGGERLVRGTAAERAILGFSEEKFRVLV